MSNYPARWVVHLPRGDLHIPYFHDDIAAAYERAGFETRLITKGREDDGLLFPLVDDPCPNCGTPCEHVVDTKGVGAAECPNCKPDGLIAGTSSGRWADD